MMSEVYNEDCMSVMSRYPDRYFDLAVVDPPYGIGVGSMNYTRGAHWYGHAKAKRRDYTGLADWDEKPPEREYFDELFRVSRKQIIWGGQYFADKLPISKGWLVWDKRCHDAMVNNFADCELAWCSTGVSRVFRFLYNGMLTGSKVKEDRFHPTQKPVELYSWIFSHYADGGYKILDTHLGSGSIRIAAYDAELDFVGCEINKEIFDKQEERFQKHIAQLSMFTGGEYEQIR